MSVSGCCEMVHHKPKLSTIMLSFETHFVATLKNLFKIILKRSNIENIPEY